MEIKSVDRRRLVEVVIDHELTNTPMAGQGGTFTKYGDEYQVDPLLAVAIAHHESHYCRAYSNAKNQAYHNCSGIMNGGEGNGLLAFDNWEAYIGYYMELLHRYIYDYGFENVAAIGARYANNSPYWAGAVSRKYQQLWMEMGQ